VEDILEQLVGEMEDEFDIAPLDQPALDDAVLAIDGAMNIRDLDAQFEIALPREAGFETLAGFVLAQMQRIPIAGDSFEFENHRFTVSEMDGHRIAKVKIEKLQPAAASQAGD
jgi:CBS domain containing-hemolysin-like protein